MSRCCAKIDPIVVLICSGDAGKSGVAFHSETMEAPELFMLESKPGELRGACTACARLFHTFVRSTDDDALRLLTRSFHVHCRLRHRIVVRPIPSGDVPIESLFKDLLLPAYVFERSSHRVIAANARFKQLMGYTDNVNGLKLEDFRAPETLPTVDESLRRNVGRGVLKRRFRTKEGRLLTVQLKYQDINLLKDETAIPDACFVVVTLCRAA